MLEVGDIACFGDYLSQFFVVNGTQVFPSKLFAHKNKIHSNFDSMRSCYYLKSSQAALKPNTQSFSESKDSTNTTRRLNKDLAILFTPPLNGLAQEMNDRDKFQNNGIAHLKVKNLNLQGRNMISTNSDTPHPITAQSLSEKCTKLIKRIYESQNSRHWISSESTSSSLIKKDMLQTFIFADQLRLLKSKIERIKFIFLIGMKVPLKTVLEEIHSHRNMKTKLAGACRLLYLFSQIVASNPIDMHHKQIFETLLHGHTLSFPILIEATTAICDGTLKQIEIFLSKINSSHPITFGFKKARRIENIIKKCRSILAEIEQEYEMYEQVAFVKQQSKTARQVLKSSLHSKYEQPVFAQSRAEISHSIAHSIHRRFPYKTASSTQHRVDSENMQRADRTNSDIEAYLDIVKWKFSASARVQYNTLLLEYAHDL